MYDMYILNLKLKKTIISLRSPNFYADNTVDHPLWIKAIQIVKQNLWTWSLCRHSSHLLMSFLGRIGGVMKGSELQGELEENYGKSTAA